MMEYDRRGGTADSLKSTSTTTTTTTTTTTVTTITTNTGTFGSGNVGDIDIVDLNMSPHLAMDSDMQMALSIQTPVSNSTVHIAPMVAANSYVIGEMMRGTSPSVSVEQTRTRSNSKHRSICGTMIEIKTPIPLQSDEEEEDDDDTNGPELSPQSPSDPDSTRNLNADAHAVVDADDRKYPLEYGTTVDIEHDTLHCIDTADVVHQRDIGPNLALAEWGGEVVALKVVSHDVFKSTKSVPAHSNVVHIYGFIGDTFRIQLVMNYMSGGSALAHFYRSSRDTAQMEKVKKGPSPREMCLVLKGVALGMVHLHRSGLLHRSICCRNILLGTLQHNAVEETTAVRLCNVGQESRKDDGGVSRNIKWSAPEVLRNGSKGIENPSSDVFSFGITMWEICCGMEPYPDLSPTNVAYQVVEKGLRPNMTEKALSFMPDGYQKLMERCWNHNVQNRPTSQQIVTELESILQKM